MKNREHLWALVMAAGDGKRLRNLTVTATGVHVPKQYCSLRGGSSLLNEAVTRAQAITHPGRVCAVVAARHEPWWRNGLDWMPEGNWIVEPLNRGTANGLLFGLLHLLDRDPQAMVVVLPSDHHVQDEVILGQSLRRAVARVSAHQDEIVLLGIEADAPDPTFGYIVPHPVEVDGLYGIADFVDKPSRGRARMLLRRGALWDSCIVVAAGRALLSLIEAHVPEVVDEMRRVVGALLGKVGPGGSPEELYGALPAVDFSREILQEAKDTQIRVLAVPCCGWSDLGTPERVAELLLRLPDRHRASVPAPGGTTQLNLAEKYLAMRSHRNNRGRIHFG